MELSGVFGPRPLSKVDRSVELQCTLVKGVRPKPKKRWTAGYVSSMPQNSSKYSDQIQAEKNQSYCQKHWYLN